MRWARLSAICRFTKSAATAVEASRGGRVSAAARNNSPDAFLTLWQEKCTSRRSVGLRSAKKSSIANLICWADSLRKTWTSKPPTDL